jgi:hypothetical protein
MPVSKDVGTFIDATNSWDYCLCSLILYLYNKRTTSNIRTNHSITAHISSLIRIPSIATPSWLP